MLARGVDPRADLGRRQHDRRPSGSGARRTSWSRGATRCGRRSGVGAGGRRRALRGAARAGEGARHARSRRRAAGDPRLVLLLAGSRARARAPRVARRASSVCRLVLLPDTPWERIVERYVVADVFALLSRHEPWGVVVNEAAACGLPLVLSDRVGRGVRPARGREERRARPGRRRRGGGRGDPRARRRPGATARDAARPRASSSRDWGYEPSIENLIGGRAQARRRASGLRAPPRRSRAARRRRRPRSTGAPRGALLPRACARSASSSRTRATACDRRLGSYGTTSASPSANDDATPVRSETITGVPTDAASAATSPKFSPPEARTNTSARR